MRGGRVQRAPLAPQPPTLLAHSPPRTFRPSVGFPAFILVRWRRSSDGTASNATTASVVNAACPPQFRHRLRAAPVRGPCSPRPPPSAAAMLRYVCLHLVSSLLLFQLLSSVEGVEEAVVVQDSRSERGGAAAAPPLPPYPNIGELNLDGKTLS